MPQDTSVGSVGNVPGLQLVAGQPAVHQVARKKVEREYCSEIGNPAPCPPGGPPTGNNCNSLY
jgi:hypothetical protein